MANKRRIQVHLPAADRQDGSSNRNPSDVHGTVRILMRDGKWLVKPGERPEVRNDGRGREPVRWPE
jgi:hypothetical protein